MTKCSVAFLFLRLSRERKHILCTNVTLIVCTVVMVISMIIVAVRCNLKEPWIFVDSQCLDQVVRDGYDLSLSLSLLLLQRPDSVQLVSLTCRLSLFAGK